MGEFVKGYSVEKFKTATNISGREFFVYSETR
jgi:hypothetical protein